MPSLAKAGAHGLVLVARDEAKLKKAEEEVHRINPKIETLLVALDVTDEAAVEQLYVKIKARYGRHADVLVNNAGVLYSRNGGGPVLHEASVEEWWKNFVSDLITDLQSVFTWEKWRMLITGVSLGNQCQGILHRIQVLHFFSSLTNHASHHYQHQHLGSVACVSHCWRL